MGGTREDGQPDPREGHVGEREEGLHVARGSNTMQRLGAMTTP